MRLQIRKSCKSNINFNLLSPFNYPAIHSIINIHQVFNSPVNVCSPYPLLSWIVCKPISSIKIISVCEIDCVRTKETRVATPREKKKFTIYIYIYIYIYRNFFLHVCVYIYIS